MDVRLAKECDIADVMRLIGECVKDLKGQGIEQWGDFYPDIDIIKDDVKREALYIIERDSDFVGIITFDENEERECKDIEWLSEDGYALVVHRLAVCPTWQGQGVGRKLMDFAEQFAIENRHSSIRLNAYSGNKRAIKFYQQRGYVKTGEVYFPKRDLPFYCYEKD